MRNKVLSALKFFSVIIILLSVWQIAAEVIDHRFLLPDIPETLTALGNLLSTKEFYEATLLTLVRVFFGFIIGILSGTALAILAFKIKYFHTLISPLVSIIKATPIASIIIILYIMLTGNTLTVLIGILMVFPIVWQNVLDAFNAMPKDLTEICYTYEIPFKKRFQILYFPTLMKYFIPAAITSSGLAWKATVSAEIIAYTTNSMGQYINDAKSNYDSPTVFAWTIVVIVFSILFEALTKYFLGRCRRWL